MLAGNTATHPPPAPVFVTVRLTTAPRTPGKPRSTVRSSPGFSFPPASRVSRTRGLEPVNGMKLWCGGLYPIVTPYTDAPGDEYQRQDGVVFGSTVIGLDS